MRNMRGSLGRGVAGVVAGASAVVGVAGCGVDQPRAVKPEAFYSQRRTVSESPLSRVDQPGQLSYPESRTGAPPAGAAPEGPVPIDAGSGVAPTPPGGIPEVVRKTVLPPEQQVAANAATEPSVAAVATTTTTTAAPSVDVATATQATTEPGVPTGQYMTLGSVIAEVNGTPIFANKVLQLVAPQLRTRARELDAAHFRQAAGQLIERTRDELIRDELEFAAAQRELTPEDKNIADALATQWRQRQITAAGGSLELARRKSAAEGTNFEEEVEKEHRLYMIQLYYTRRITPRIQVSGNDIRNFYNAHADQFSEQSSVTFRLLRVDPNQLDPNDAAHGKELALQRIKEIRERALKGEDFAQLVKEYSNDTAYRDKPVGPVGKGALALKKVEAAVFDLQPGQVSDVVEDRGGYYLLKVEDRKTGRVEPFESPEAQERIRLTLRAEQLRKLREQERQKLIQNAIIRSSEDMIDAAVQMAMENYPRWSKRA